MLPTNPNLPLHDYASGVEELDARRARDDGHWLAGFADGVVLGVLVALAGMILVLTFAR